MFLLLRRPEELEADEQETLAQLRSLHPEVDQAYVLVQQFAHMLHTRTGEQLDEWLCRVKASKIRELQGFLGFRDTRQSSRGGRADPSPKQRSG